MVEEAYLVKAEDAILIKKAIAIKLYKKKIDQLRISKILNITQPMVSNYCSSNDNIPKKILNLAEDISNRIVDNNLAHFYSCITFSDNNLRGRYYIAEKNEIISDEKSNIINNLIEAFLLLKGKDISRLVPEVKINIAMAKQNALNSEDVAAFLNGLIIADDKVTNNNGIRFGKSKHLSSLLIYLRDYLKINSIMNIAFIENIEETGFLYGYLSKDYKFDNGKNNVDILLHKGDFGIEPCSYVLGKNAVDVVKKVIKISEVIK